MRAAFGPTTCSATPRPNSLLRGDNAVALANTITLANAIGVAACLQIASEDTASRTTSCLDATGANVSDSVTERHTRSAY